MKNLLKISLATIMSSFLLWSCTQDVDLSDGGGYVIPEGQGDMTLGFTFEAATNALETRGVQGDLDFGIRDLTVFFYDAKNGTEDDNQAPVYTFTFNRNDFDVYEKEHRDPAHCEEWTYHGLVTIKDVEYGAYRIYGVANAKYLLEQQNGAATANENEKVKYNLSEKQLRELKVCWDCNDNTDLPAGQYNVPDAMFGYFTVEGVQDHERETYRNVIYHQDLSLYEGNAESSTDHKDKNRAGVVVLNKRSLEVQAWLKRVVSKVTVGFDGTGLKSGVEVYIKSVSIVDAPTECYLGQDNTVSSDTEFVNDEELTDARLNIIYSDVAGANGYVLSKEYPAFPRAEQNSKIDPEVEKETNVWDWNPEWYDYVHGSLENTNPTWNDQPITLYFLENLQGVDTEHPKVKLQSKESNDHYASEDHVTDAENCTYYKDGKPYGTYVEVKAYYRNTKKQTQGEITYRFMLGKNIENDFNAERNHHYKLTMSFLGDANNVDWHIDYKEEKNPFFAIPSDDGHTAGAYGNYNWSESWVWHAYNDAGEPIAEICRELVYHDANDLEVAEGTAFNGRRNGLTYYQVVTVYPIKKDLNEPGRYIVDMAKGKVAQVLKCADKDVMGDDDLKAGGDINMLLRTQAVPEFWNYEPAAAHGGQYAIRSLTNGGEDNYDYVELLSDDFTVEANDTYTLTIKAKQTGVFGSKMWEPKHVDKMENSDKKEYDLKLGEKQQKELRIRPYTVQDADGNIYPVVKIGASYWSRENLRTKSYFKTTTDGKYALGGGKIYPFKGPKETQEYKYRTDDRDDAFETETIEGVADGYDYDFGPHELTEGYVNFYERYPMYKECNGEILYNFFAASGTRGEVLSDGSETFKKTSNSPYGGYIDPFYHQVDYYWGLDQGTVDPKYSSFAKNESGAYVDFTFDTSDTYEFSAFNDSEETDNYNKSLAPNGWHALVTEETVYPGNFGELESDQDYLETFANFNYEHMLNPNGFASWSWPETSSGMVNRGLSGLDLTPIPYDWETNKTDIVFKKFNEISINNESDLHGMTFGFWTETISDEFAYNSRWQMTYELYPISAMICIDNESNGLVRELFNEDRYYNLAIPKAYLPIRLVRNAYDYTVTMIEPK